MFRGLVDLITFKKYIEKLCTQSLRMTEVKENMASEAIINGSGFLQICDKVKESFSLL